MRARACLELTVFMPKLPSSKKKAKHSRDVQLRNVAVNELAFGPLALGAYNYVSDVHIRDYFFFIK